MRPEKKPTESSDAAMADEPTERLCDDDVHYWHETADAEGDTCNCGVLSVDEAMACEMGDCKIVNWHVPKSKPPKRKQPKRKKQR